MKKLDLVETWETYTVKYGASEIFTWKQAGIWALEQPSIIVGVERDAKLEWNCKCLEGQVQRLATRCGCTVKRIVH